MYLGIVYANGSSITTDMVNRRAIPPIESANVSQSGEGKDKGEGMFLARIDVILANNSATTNRTQATFAYLHRFHVSRLSLKRRKNPPANTKLTNIIRRYITVWMINDVMGEDAPQSCKALFGIRRYNVAAMKTAYSKAGNHIRLNISGRLSMYAQKASLIHLLLLLGLNKSIFISSNV